jgi:uncharacterized membrane protein
MANKTLLFLVSGVLITIVIGSLILFLIPRLGDWSFSSSTRDQDGLSVYGDAVQAEVVEIVEEGDITLGDHIQPFQILRVQLLEGQFIGRQVIIDYGQRQIRPEGLNLRPGEKILVTVGQQPDGTLTAYFTDFVRTRPLLWLLGTFVAFSILISGWKGVRSLIGMAISLTVIVAYIIPQILAGEDPVWVSITGGFVLMAVTLYLVYGWTLKTHSAILGMLLALLITGALSSFFVDLTRLTGAGSEEGLFLIQQSQASINLRGLVLGGMLIGALGVLDDLVATQASAVFELHAADPSLAMRDLFRRAMRIGQDHVAATINTLVLAYAGAALPMLLLFSLSGEKFSYLVNIEIVTEEIVRTLVGSLGLISAVPITTGLASLIATHHARLGSLRPLLGPENLGGHGNSH